MSRVARWRAETLGVLGTTEGPPTAGYDNFPEPSTLEEFWEIHARCSDDGVEYGRDEAFGEVACVKCRACANASLWFMPGGGPPEIFREVSDEG